MDRAGVDLPHLPHLFARFYRVDAGRTSDSGDGVAVGHGLGMEHYRAAAAAGYYSEDQPIWDEDRQ